MDEIWNFVNSRNISNGLIPYKDFNLITTPLNFILNSFLLKFNETLFCYRIIEIIRGDYFLNITFSCNRYKEKRRYEYRINST